MKIKNTIINLILFLLSLMLLYFSFPATHWSNYLLIWIAFVPLLFLLLKISNHKTRFLVSWFFFQLFFILLFRINPFNLETCFYQPGNLWGTLFLVLSIPLPYAIVIFVMTLFSRKPLLQTALFTLTEMIIFQHVLSYPMAAAVTQFNNLYLLQLCSITGIYGLSFLIIFFNTSLFASLFHRNKSSFLYLTVSLLLITIALGYGFLHINSSSDQTKKTYSLALIQPNHSWMFAIMAQQNQVIKDQYLNNYLKMTKQAIEEDQPNLVIWPEGAVKTTSASEIAKHFKEWHQDVIFGGFSIDHKTKKIQNSIYLYSADKDSLSLYSKEKLTPFFESGLFNPKKDNHPLLLNNKKLSIGPLVCFEALFSQIARKHVAQGANLLICHSDDSFFRGSNLVILHAVYMVFRAVEFSRPAVFTNNNGLSLVADHLGRFSL